MTPSHGARWRYDHDPGSNWVALERFSAASRLRLDPAEFMWMGAVTLGDGRVVHAYKHIHTRRYLDLDGAGHAYTVRAGAHVPLPSPAAAIEALNLGAGRSVP